MSNEGKQIPELSELGKKSEYDSSYNPEKLYPIPRKMKRDEIGVPEEPPFHGYDLWNHYEVSWLNLKGKPVVALAEIVYGADTPNIIESKSMKLYFNSFNNSRYADSESVRTTIENDISLNVGGSVYVRLFTLSESNLFDSIRGMDGVCLDNLDIECHDFLVNADYLHAESEIVEETVHSNLLKSNCLVTNQPDWGSVQIEYKGRRINHEGLLRYIVSFRNHNEFHEQCIERIFMDIMRMCQPEELTVYGRYTRRGGLDINPYRSTKPIQQGQWKNTRLCRQ